MTESALTIFSVWLPCGLWQSEHESSPSRTEWCEFFQVSARTCWWQVAHCSLAEAVLSCPSADFGACTEWQVTHDSPRFACTLPCQWNCERPS